MAGNPGDEVPVQVPDLPRFQNVQRRGWNYLEMPLNGGKPGLYTLVTLDSENEKEILPAPGMIHDLPVAF